MKKKDENPEYLGIYVYAYRLYVCLPVCLCENRALMITAEKTKKMKKGKKTEKANPIKPR